MIPLLRLLCWLVLPQPSQLHSVDEVAQSQPREEPQPREEQWVLLVDEGQRNED